LGPQLAIAVLGLPAGYVLAGLVEPSTIIDARGAPGELLITALILVVFVGFVEEFIFRGVIQAGLSATYTRGAVLIGAILYGSTYLASLSFAYATYMTLIGLAYGVVAQRTGSIVGVSASHALLALGALLVWPALSGG
jgi:membrane protease YdiL (CAAX protease family)